MQHTIRLSSVSCPNASNMIKLQLLLSTNWQVYVCSAAHTECPVGGRCPGRQWWRLSTQTTTSNLSPEARQADIFSVIAPQTRARTHTHPNTHTNNNRSGAVAWTRTCLCALRRRIGVCEYADVMYENTHSQSPWQSEPEPESKSQSQRALEREIGKGLVMIVMIANDTFEPSTYV